MEGFGLGGGGGGMCWKDVLEECHCKTKLFPRWEPMKEWRWAICFELQFAEGNHLTSHFRMQLSVLISILLLLE